MHSWKDLLADEFEARGEGWENVVAHTFADDQLMRQFDCSYGSAEGVGFTLWTENFVYFPVCYDGAEWVGSVPRNPNDEVTQHHGGG